MIVNSLFARKLDYCTAVFYGINELLIQELQFGQNPHVGNTLKDLHWLPVQRKIKYKTLLLVFKCQPPVMDLACPLHFISSVSSELKVSISKYFPKASNR